MSVNELVKMSNKYGANPEFVLAGGGNTSFKTNEILYIKGSGTSLSTITEEGFVKMDNLKLSNMWQKDYGTDVNLTEKLVLRDMMDARLLGEEEKRPSVETLLHQLMPFKLVLHLHPALVNGLTCAKSGEKIYNELFGEKEGVLFISITDPGYILAQRAKKETDAFIKRNGSFPNVIFMQNHGVFWGADTLSEMDALVENTMNKLKSVLKRTPDLSEINPPLDKGEIVSSAVKLRTLFKMREGSGICTFFNNGEIARVIKDEKTFKAAAGQSITPDHIVYCRYEPLFINDTNEIEKDFNSFAAKNSVSPKIVFIKNVGMFALGKTKKESDIAGAVYIDELKISAYAESFGGPLFMPKKHVDFIVNWEVESYRQKVSLGAGEKRLNQKIALITGAAQGYGKGIAEEMALEGANVIIADLNYDGAVSTAKEIESRFGKGSAFAVKVDVSSEDDVKRVTEEIVINYGGLDILINNAGVLKAGSLDEMDVKSFEFVTKINYNAFFICTKYASKIMKTQTALDKKSFCDIIQINSKSGLTGSNKNFAYAGSKFGGIGLTQSFALELTPYNIKVNSICPGNFFDGPLWSDPVNGLFVQYLNTGKVVGAKTVADVKAAYEAKIPMNRGCEIKDVARAIFYVVEQEYETGQAVPVTGGQVMLK